MDKWSLVGITFAMSSPRAGTENSLPDLEGFDTWDDHRILLTLLGGQRRAIDAVQQALPQIAKAANAVAAAVAAGGCLVYAGAGTSIRVAVQDGTELPATFGMAEDQLKYLIAGGRNAMFETMADAEDDEVAGENAASVCSAKDVLIAVAASGRTPYTIAAARKARANGTVVIAVVNNPDSPLAKLAHIEVLLNSGPEVISGSTRMGAGTAQKAALNFISTLAHIKLGAVHDGLMVNVQAGNSKLLARSRGIVARIASVSDAAAGAALARSAGNVKVAILLCKGAPDMSAAQIALAGARGNLRTALAQLPLSPPNRAV